MAHIHRSRDNLLIDAIEAIDPIEFAGSVWRIVREVRDPTRCARSGGRWDDGTFDVLYTAQERDGAIGEMYFHLARGLPVFPSQVKYRLHELTIALDRALKLIDLEALAELGMQTAHFGRLSYQERKIEYPRSQDIAETAHFLDFDGLIVPSARADYLNIVLFCDRIPPSAIEAKKDHGLVDWSSWKQ